MARCRAPNPCLPQQQDIIPHVEKNLRLALLKMGKRLPETCWADHWRSKKLLLLHLVGFYFTLPTLKMELNVIGEGFPIHYNVTEWSAVGLLKSPYLSVHQHVGSSALMKGPAKCWTGFNKTRHLIQRWRLEKFHRNVFITVNCSLATSFCTLHVILILLPPSSVFSLSCVVM